MFKPDSKSSRLSVRNNLAGCSDDHPTETLQNVLGYIIANSGMSRFYFSKDYRQPIDKAFGG